MMDVAFIGGRGLFSNYGGVENATREIAKKLNESGLSVCVYGSDHDISSQNEIGVSTIYPFYRGASSHILWVFYAVLHAIFIGRPKTVILFASGPCIFTPLLRICGLKVITSLRAVDSERDKWGAVSRYTLRLGEYFAWRFASHFTVNSLEMQRRFLKKRLDTVFIPNGVRFETLEYEKVLDDMGLKYESFFLFAARLDPVKRLHLLVQAFKELPEDQRPPLVVAGGNSKDENYEIKIKEDAPSDIIFLGHIDQNLLDKLTAGCLAFVLPSVLEGMSNSLLSAMAFSRAVVAADIPENRDVVKTDDALFIADDVEDMKAKLIRLMNDKAFTQSLGEKLNNVVRENNSWERTANQFKDLIDVS